MGLDPRQVLEIAIRPGLRAVAQAVPGADSEAAEVLVFGTAAHESDGFRFLRQRGGGPAIGLFQMEPATYRDLWERIVVPRQALYVAILGLASRGAGGAPPPGEMAGTLPFAAAMCRMKYLSVPDPIPPARAVEAHARLWKKRYNTPAGAGTEAQFIEHFHRYCAPTLGWR